MDAVAGLEAQGATDCGWDCEAAVGEEFGGEPGGHGGEMITIFGSLAVDFRGN